MQKKYIIGIVLFFFLGFLQVSAYDFNLKSSHALLINLDEQKVLYEQDSESKTAIASLTKIMTAIVSLENIESLDETVIITSADLKGLAASNAAVAGFFVGEKVTYRDLLYGLLLPSGADAAQALTRLTLGSRENFVSKMNEKAKELGLTNTNFVNETGLDVENHYSSLQDVAKMFQYALKNDDFRTIISSSSYLISDGTKTLQSTVFRNIKKNNLNMDYVMGGKTGTTENAGICLASIANANGTNYMLITTGAPQENNQPYNFLDTQKIYDYFIKNFQKQIIVEKGSLMLELPTIYAKEESVSFEVPESIEKYVSTSFQKDQIQYKYFGMEEIKYDTPLMTKLGTVQIILDGEILREIEIILNQNIHFDLWKYVKSNPVIIVGIIGFVILIMIMIVRRKCRKK